MIKNVLGSKSEMEQNRDLGGTISHIKLWHELLQLEISPDWSKLESGAWSQIKALFMCFWLIVPHRSYLNNISVEKQSDNNVRSNQGFAQFAIFPKWASHPKEWTCTKIVFYHLSPLWWCGREYFRCKSQILSHSAEERPCIKAANYH